VDVFLRELQASGTGDLNAVFATLNEGALCREALAYWTDKHWVVVAPHSPLLALRGEALHRGVDLHEFCGQEPPPAGDSAQPSARDVAAKGESKTHEDS
jgi:hypothetical protein